MAENAEGATAPAAPAEAPASRKRSTVADWSTTRLKRTLRLANMCNGVLLITLGILIFLVGFLNVTFQTVTVSAYVVFFGSLMTCLECNIAGLAPRFQRNFGFMFSFVGRTLFIIFAGTMALSMGQWLAYTIGAITFLNGLFNGYVICVHPAFKTGELSARGDPFGGYTGGEKEMLSYLQSKPQLAQKATSAAATFAASNPQMAMQVLGAASQNGGAGGAGSSNPWK